MLASPSPVEKVCHVDQAGGGPRSVSVITASVSHSGSVGTLRISTFALGAAGNFTTAKGANFGAAPPEVASLDSEQVVRPFIEALALGLAWWPVPLTLP